MDVNVNESTLDTSGQRGDDYQTTPLVKSPGFHERCLYSAFKQAETGFVYLNLNTNNTAIVGWLTRANTVLIFAVIKLLYLCILMRLNIAYLN
jgi:hypothetical protein